MARWVTVGAIQLPARVERRAPAERRQANLETALAYLDQAGQARCDIACLPEAFNVWGVAPAAYAEQADELGLGPQPQPPPETAPALTAVAQAARRWGMYVVAPVIARVDGRLRNTAFLLDRQGQIAGAYHKVHLTTPEREWGLEPGEAFPVFACDFGRVGVMTCFDVSFPESARILALEGAEILFFPHMQSYYGEVGWEITVRSRAIDNAVYVVSANYGYHPDEPWMPGMILGRSNVIGPDGIVLADAGRATGLVTARLDLDRRRWVRCFGVAEEADFRAEMLRHRRPQAYGPIAAVPGPAAATESSGVRENVAS